MNPFLSSFTTQNVNFLDNCPNTAVQQQIQHQDGLEYDGWGPGDGDLRELRGGASLHGDAPDEAGPGWKGSPHQAEGNDGEVLRSGDLRVLVVEFSRNQESVSDCVSSFFCDTEASKSVSQEASLSSIRELQEDFLQFEFLNE